LSLSFPYIDDISDIVIKSVCIFVEKRIVNSIIIVAEENKEVKDILTELRREIRW